ncbi:polyketide cyclase, partial [Pseudoalteromonas citrea]
LLYLRTALLLISLFFKKSYFLERSVVIEQPLCVVFVFIKYLKKQDHYFRWGNSYPDMLKAYRGTVEHVGFVSAWSS